MTNTIALPHRCQRTDGHRTHSCTPFNPSLDHGSSGSRTRRSRSPSWGPGRRFPVSRQLRCMAIVWPSCRFWVPVSHASSMAAR